MSKQVPEPLGPKLWDIVVQLRGNTRFDNIRDYVLALLVLRHLSAINEAVAGKAGCVIKPEYLWSSIAEMASLGHECLLDTLLQSFKHIEENAFDGKFQGLFAEIHLQTERFGCGSTELHEILCATIKKITETITEPCTDFDILGGAYVYLLGKFADSTRRLSSELCTPRQVSTILSAIVTFDSHKPAKGKVKKLNNVLDFACGTGSLLLNLRNQIGPHKIDKIFGQDNDIANCNLARMNMLAHGVKDTEFEIHCGDSLLNDWNILNEADSAKKMRFDAIVAHPPLIHRWTPSENLDKDLRFKNYGLAPDLVADLAFLLHGFHFLSDEGVMAMTLSYGTMSRDGVEQSIRKKLLEDGNIDAVISLPNNILFATGLPIYILVLKKHKSFDDVLFINASRGYENNVARNRLLHTSEMPDGKIGHVEKIVDTYQHRKEEALYSRRVSMQEIRKNNYNIAIAPYVSITAPKKKINLAEVNDELVAIKKTTAVATQKHNEILKQLGLPLLPNQ